MVKGLSYDELMLLAKEHYNEGGDFTYECASEQWYNDYVSMFGAMTRKDALEMFRRDKARYDEIMSF